MSDAMAEKLIRVIPGDPRQCEAIRPGMGLQCHFQAVEDGRMCPMHGGSDRAIKAKSFNNYRLGKYQKRMREFVDSSGLRTVDEEIGILRMLLEEVFAKCNDGVDLLLYSEKISNLVQDITKCVQVADRLATKSGMVISRNEAVLVGQRVIEIISEHIPDEDKLLAIAESISEAFMLIPEGNEATSFSRNINISSIPTQRVTNASDQASIA